MSILPLVRRLTDACTKGIGVHDRIVTGFAQRFGGRRVGV
jgi:hypothetical protein